MADTPLEIKEEGKGTTEPVETKPPTPPSKPTPQPEALISLDDYIESIGETLYKGWLGRVFRNNLEPKTRTEWKKLIDPKLEEAKGPKK